MADDISVKVPGDSGEPVAVAAWRFQGQGSAPSVYLQAGLHADEIAGMLVLHLLLERLHQAEYEGRINGTITVVPQANPLGIGQFRWGRGVGRFHESSGQNFNRHFDHSLSLTRPTGNFALWQRALVGLAAEADYVLDLHTDDEALPYLYMHRSCWPAGADLAAALHADVAIIWDDGGDGSFEEVIIAPWLAQNSVGKLAATIELRGQGDVSDALAEQDAQGLYDWLCHRGVVAADSTTQQLSPWQGVAVEMGHMESIFAPVPGVLIFEKELGCYVEEGERFARIIKRPGDPTSEVVLRAPQAGRFVTRYRDRLVPQGAVVAKFTGSKPSESWSGGVLDP
ncbi:succinylglutamate desuccinylase/aspartoacylase family protein [Pseudomonas sp. NA-150]|uniref:succinylglutamate desuccinylase/aspartoacylase domain-containing protein n=1 Tax=Pseudomonas sp. NA-150 TaxID=3367525 RepID=UPI0037CC9328